MEERVRRDAERATREKNKAAQAQKASKNEEAKSNSPEHQVSAPKPSQSKKTASTSNQHGRHASIDALPGELVGDDPLFASKKSVLVEQIRKLEKLLAQKEKELSVAYARLEEMGADVPRQEAPRVAQAESKAGASPSRTKTTDKSSGAPTSKQEAALNGLQKHTASNGSHAVDSGARSGPTSTVAPSGTEGQHDSRTSARPYGGISIQRGAPVPSQGHPQAGSIGIQGSSQAQPLVPSQGNGSLHGQGMAGVHPAATAPTPKLANGIMAHQAHPAHHAFQQYPTGMVSGRGEPPGSPIAGGKERDSGSMGRTTGMQAFRTRQEEQDLSSRGQSTPVGAQMKQVNSASQVGESPGLQEFPHLNLINDLLDFDA